MSSYAMSTNYLRDNVNQFSEEDMAALQATMADKDPDMHHHPAEGGGDYDNHYDKENREEGIGGIDRMIDNSHDMSYDALLRLGEQIGLVKEEQWALIAHKKKQMKCVSN